MKFISTIFLLFTFSSCYHVYYAPNTPNVTQLTEKNEVRINTGLISGFESELTGVDLQLAYAPAKNFGLMLNGFTAWEKEQAPNDAIETGKGSYGEFGIGYFTTFDKEKEWTFEVFAGAGGGKVRNEYDAMDYSEVSVSKIFLQPAFGYKWDHIEFAFVPRLSYVNGKVTSFKTTNSSVQGDMEFIRQKPDYLTFEPGLILRGGGKRVKAQVGLTFGSMSANEYVNYEPPTESVVGYIGMSFNLSAKKKPQIKSVDSN